MTEPLDRSETVSSPRLRRALVLMLLTEVAGACNEPIYGPPPPLEVSLQPAMIWGVGDVTLTSDGFRGFDLTPQQDSSGPVPRRWSNFAVQIAGDTVDSWRIDDSTMAATVPWLLTGVYPLTVLGPSGNQGSAELEIVGFRHSYDVYFDAPNGRRTIFWRWVPELGMPPRGLVSFQMYAPDQASLVWLDLPTRLAYAVADIEASGGDAVMWGPGPSYLSEHVVADLLGDGLGPVSLRLMGSGQPETSHQVPCQPPEPKSYAVAEVGPGGRCIGWWDFTFWANGVDAMVQRPGWWNPSFRMSADGSRTIPILPPWSCPYTVEPPASAWLVFDATPAVAYELDDVSCVLGAAFSLDGDTLYLVAQDTVAEWASRKRTVQARDASDGRLLNSHLVEGTPELYDVLPDPVRPWLYVALARPQEGLSLLVLHRETMEQVALIEYSSWRPFHGNLVWGGSWGVYFYGTYDCVGDCGMVWEFDTPVQYPP